MANQPVWGPVDEPAHADYIEKLSNGKCPSNINTLVEESIYQSYSNHGEELSEPEIGLKAYSYELQQPPLYYLCMSIPNRLMIAMHIPLIQRVWILRIFSWLIFLAGIICGVLLIRKFMHHYFPGNPVPIKALYVLFVLHAGSFNRFGLSNDWFSVPIANFCLLLPWNYIRNPSARRAIYAHSLVMLLFLSKQTNYLLALLLAIFITYKMLQNYKHNRQNIMLCFIIYLPAIAWVIRFLSSYTFDNPVSQAFGNILPAGLFEFRFFIELLTDDMFHISHLYSIEKTPGIWIWLLIVPGFFFPLFLRHMRVFLAKAGLIIFLLFCMWFALNKWIGGVHWFAFRHYAGYGIFIFAGMILWLPSFLYLIKKNRLHSS